MNIETRRVVVLQHDDKGKLDDLIKYLQCAKDGDSFDGKDTDDYIDEVIGYLKSLNYNID